MSVSLNPGIGGLEPGSLTYTVYRHLYTGFFNAQDKKDAGHPWGITEGDDTSIRLHNLAYNFAEAIAYGMTGDGGESSGGILLDYLKRSGGVMTGSLTANYGFEAGIANTKVLEIFEEDITGDDNVIVPPSYGVKIYGDLNTGGALLLNNEKLIAYDNTSKTAYITSSSIDFSDSRLFSKGSILFGSKKESGVYISPQHLQVNGNNVYHEGNANRATVDWLMYNASVGGGLFVENITQLNGLLHACNGVELGIGNEIILDIRSDGCVNINNHLSFASGYGIKIEGIPVLVRVSKDDIQLGAIGGDLILGNDLTNKIKLYAGISDIDGQYLLLSKYGAAYFPYSLSVRHNYGDLLLSSYRVDSSDEGIIIHKKLRFEDSKGSYLSGKPDGLAFCSSVIRYKDTESYVFKHETSFSYRASESYYRPLDRLSNSLFIDTDADFITYRKPLEAEGHIGINNSFTRLTAKGLFFSNEKYLLSATDGIKHYGNAYFLNSLSSEFFSSGFAGSGWAIIHNKTTGNVAATFDELTIRKKMRVYELEVQKISATNGSLWVSDNCSGDRVVKL
ncbi:hypothetical protein IR083_07325 [Dysgonomonas sp. GY75]|uniref:hypothetical protein n=1 Tax=Dysgonomonas sp. GY75 TaxID=2780419 RepID=UPI0018831AD0|nr:hypothetical protein [Dysgonomonas sp. GY75]MBF0648626.1 hypothetical protein [Dysgonomonas sp. GY75]